MFITVLFIVQVFVLKRDNEYFTNQNLARIFFLASLNFQYTDPSNTIIISCLWLSKDRIRFLLKTLNCWCICIMYLFNGDTIITDSRRVLNRIVNSLLPYYILMTYLRIQWKPICNWFANTGTLFGTIRPRRGIQLHGYYRPTFLCRS